MTARDRITDVVEKWFLVEPLLFAVWTTHELAVNPRLRSIRVHQGRVEYNPAFIVALDRRQHAEVLALEAMRILLKHPYARRPANAEPAYAASNLTLQEYLETSRPLPRARDVFGGPEFDRQYYEFYYHKLVERIASGALETGDLSSGADAPGRVMPGVEGARRPRRRRRVRASARKTPGRDRPLSLTPTRRSAAARTPTMGGGRAARRPDQRSIRTAQENGPGAHPADGRSASWRRCGRS